MDKVEFKPGDRIVVLPHNNFPGGKGTILRYWGGGCIEYRLDAEVQYGARCSDTWNSFREHIVPDVALDSLSGLADMEHKQYGYIKTRPETREADPPKEAVETKTEHDRMREFFFPKKEYSAPFELGHKAKVVQEACACCGSARFVVRCSWPGFYPETVKCPECNGTGRHSKRIP